MSKFDQSMNEFLGIDETENLPALSTEQKEIILHQTLDIDFQKDYEIARENFHELIDKGKDAFDSIVEIAGQSERSKDFETAAILLNNIITANKELIEMHKRVREITNYKQSIKNDTKIQNALFVGSTAELSKIIKDLKENDVIEG